MISIHPPREGWDRQAFKHCKSLMAFQSTHPVRGGTFYPKGIHMFCGISIHPPREGWDLYANVYVPMGYYFNPPTP